MIEMFFGDMSTVLKPSDSYAMVLTEAEGGKDRKLAVIYRGSGSPGHQNGPDRLPDTASIYP